MLTAWDTELRLLLAAMIKFSNTTSIFLQPVTTQLRALLGSQSLVAANGEEVPITKRKDKDKDPTIDLSEVYHYCATHPQSSWASAIRMFCLANRQPTFLLKQITFWRGGACFSSN